MSKQAKAIAALLSSALGVAVAFGALDDGAAQTLVAVLTPVVTYGLTWLIPNSQ